MLPRVAGDLATMEHRRGVVERTVGGGFGDADGRGDAGARAGRPGGRRAPRGGGERARVVEGVGVCVLEGWGACYRSSTSLLLFAPEQQIIIRVFSAFSAALSTRSRWSGVPPSTRTSQVPQMPSRHE